MVKESINGDTKEGGGLLCWSKQGRRYFYSFPSSVFPSVFKWEEDVVFHICVCRSDKNNGVNLVLMWMTYL